jgi:hypothetical protein
MGEKAVRNDDLTVDVVWSAKAAAAYARVTTTAQLAVVGQGERKWSSVAGAAAAVLAGAGAFALSHSALWSMLATFGGLAAVFAGQWSYYADLRSRAVVERLFAGDPEAYPPRKVILDQTHLSEISEGLSWRVALPRIKRVSHEDGLLMVWISRSDALAIPEQCFATPEEGMVFAQTLTARIAAARG